MAIKQLDCLIAWHQAAVKYPGALSFLRAWDMLPVTL
ncbi:hypothetical protein HNR62_000093 [Oceanisphaera litoralis]|nr:hypothetical protein [Oceanisphaera litoralis]